VVYLFARSLPLVDGFGEKRQKVKKPRKFIKEEWVEAFDTKTSAVFSKWLRKAKLTIMKMDNVVSRNIDRIKERSASKEENTDHVVGTLHEESKREEEK